MLLPDSEGLLNCESDCDFATPDIFELFDHCGVDFEWSIKISKVYSFNLFDFLQKLNEVINVGDLDKAYDIVQDASLLLANASSGEIDEFIDECLILDGIEDTMSGLERMLKDNG
jgi:hypothetical protein